MFQDDYDELANPSTELLLSLAELRRDQFVLWQDGTAPKEMVGMLIGRLVAGLQGIDDGVEEWKAETDVCSFSRFLLYFVSNSRLMAV